MQTHEGKEKTAPKGEKKRARCFAALIPASGRFTRFFVMAFQENQETTATRKHPFAEIYLNERQAAQKIGVTASAMQSWRLRGDGPPFVKISCRCIRYSESAIDDWMLTRECKSTAERPNPNVNKESKRKPARAARR